MAKIFLSFSGEYARQVAGELHKLLISVHPDLDLFYSEYMKNGRWHKTLLEELAEYDYGIFLLTADNYCAPWMQFEAGALALKGHQLGLKSGENLWFIRIDRKIDQIESTFAQYHSIPMCKEHMEVLLQQLDRIVCSTVSTSVFQEQWCIFSAALELLNIDRQATAIISSQEEFYIDKKTLLELLPADATTLSVEMLPTLLHKYVDFTIDSKYRTTKQVNMGKSRKVESSEIWINNTRFSTFFCFTDLTQVLFFDRKHAAKEFITNQNDRYDVFGSVEFENNSLYKKITSEKFLNCIVLDILTIPGVSCEDNESKHRSFSRETVIMFGFLIVMTSDDLDLACDEKKLVTKWPLNGKLPSKNNLTSKANLAVEALRTIARR